MTITRTAPHFLRVHALLVLGALLFVLPAIASAWQTRAQPAQPVIRPVPSSVRFQQAAQQQHATDQLQKSQLQQQLHQSVSDNAKRPTVKDVRTQRQLDAADSVQRDRDRARQRDLLDRERDSSNLPRVIPKAMPAPPQSSR